MKIKAAEWALIGVGFTVHGVICHPDRWWWGSFAVVFMLGAWLTRKGQPS